MTVLRALIVLLEIHVMIVMDPMVDARFVPEVEICVDEIFLPSKYRPVFVKQVINLIEGLVVDEKL